MLAAVDGDKVQPAAGVTADAMGKVKAGELVNLVASQVGGKGGGKPDMAMAGGTQPVAVPAALPAWRPRKQVGRAPVEQCRLNKNRSVSGLFLFGRESQAASGVHRPSRRCSSGLRCPSGSACGH